MFIFLNIKKNDGVSSDSATLPLLKGGIPIPTEIATTSLMTQLVDQVKSQQPLYMQLRAAAEKRNDRID